MSDSFDKLKEDVIALAKAACEVRDAFHYDPGHSDLDNEQPITITIPLGKWRALNRALRTFQ